MSVERRIVTAVDAPAASGGYAQAVEVRGSPRLLFISGQIPLDAAGVLPATFRDQCMQVWHNVGAQLRASDMTFEHLVKVTIFLADRRHADENRAVRQSVLGEHSPALTVIITGIFDESWLVEIEAVAAA